MKIVEYYIRQVISEGIKQLRDDPIALSEIFSELACSPLDTVFGHKVIDEIKCFFTQNDIPVKSAFTTNIDLPSITVHLISSLEESQYGAMQDHIWFERVPSPAAMIQGMFYGIDYDEESGKLFFSKTLDMTEFKNGRKIFSVEDDEVYTIKPTIKINEPDTPASELEDQYVSIVNSDGDIPSKVDFSRMYLMSSVDFKLKRLAGIWLRETFEIRVNAATNSDQAIWLYYIALYILLRNKKSFEDIGLESQTFTSGDFNRDTSKIPNNMWGRTIRLTFLVQHTWSEYVDALELTDININVQSNVTNQITTIGD